MHVLTCIAYRYRAFGINCMRITHKLAGDYSYINVATIRLQVNVRMSQQHRRKCNQRAHTVVSFCDSDETSLVGV